ncbi:ferredoxin reductase [Cupriavidus basilensis]
MTSAEGIRSFELVQPDGTDLPPFTPGSHIKVQTPNGLPRKYSLCNDPAERHRYLITVKRDANGQGGSMSLCDDAREGDLLPVGVPENAFPLVGNARAFIFIAGGIGITPILSMIRSFGELSNGQGSSTISRAHRRPPRSWMSCRHPNSGARVTIHHDFGDPDKAFDLWPVLEQPCDTHVYCCGPRGLMNGRA